MCSGDRLLTRAPRPHTLSLPPSSPQGLLTNDVTRLQPATAAPLAAALLTPAGRVVSDFFLHRRDSPTAPTTPTLLADVDAAAADGVLALLCRYKLRAAVDVADASGEWQVWASVAAKGEGDPPPPATAAWPADPRGVAALGVRGLVSSEEGGSLSEAGGGEGAYTRARYQAGVPEGPDLDPGRGTPLEACLDGLAAIAFDKGCYVGQELVARAHFRGEVRKRVMPVRLVPPDASTTTWPPPLGASLAPGPGTSRPAGRLVATDAGARVGLALLRLDAALPAAAAGSVLPFEEGGQGCIVPSVPAWWPAEWSGLNAGT